MLSTRTLYKAPSGEYIPYFPAPLMKLHNSQIKLNGYMVPIKADQFHKNFLISVLPIL